MSTDPSSQSSRVAALLRRRNSTAIRPATSPEDLFVAETTPQPARVPGRRNPKWIALGVLAICLGGLLSYVVYTRVATESTVVAMAATVYRGEVIDQGDLTTLTLGGSPGVTTVPSDQLQSLVGQRAAFDLVEGALVPAGAAKALTVPASSRSVVGVRLSAGRAPTGFLQAGAPIRLIVVPPPNAQPGFTDGYQSKNYAAVIVDAQPGAEEGSLLLNLDVAADQASAIALLASTDRIAVIREADR